MRRKKSRLTPIEGHIIASQYREGMPLREICAKNNCARGTIANAARLHGVKVPRPKKEKVKS